MCLPFLRWNHHFNEPGTAKFPLNTWDKVRNYVLGYLELGRDLTEVYEHFVVPGQLAEQRRLSEAQWKYLLADPVAHEQPPKPAPPTPPKEIIGVEGLYQAVLAMPQDLEKHMPYLRELASRCCTVTEFAKRKHSTIAFAAGGAGVTSYNLVAGDAYLNKLPYLVTDIAIHNKPSTAVPKIDDTDLLFLDSQHTAKRLAEELSKYHRSVRRYLVFHDTHQHANRGEDGSTPGLVSVIKDFVTHNSEWFVVSHTREQYGLSVLGKLPEDRPAKRVWMWPPGYGPGTELTGILKSLAIEPDPGCDCRGKAVQMDMWGVEGCRENHLTIVNWMKEGVPRWGWKDRLSAAARSVTTGLAFKLNPLDPFPSLIDEAINRAEAKELALEQTSHANAILDQQLNPPR